jgi:hypothetical protein
VGSHPLSTITGRFVLAGHSPPRWTRLACVSKVRTRPENTDDPGERPEAHSLEAAGFQTRDRRLGQARPPCQLTLRHAEPKAGIPNRRADD